MVGADMALWPETARLRLQSRVCTNRINVFFCRMARSEKRASAARPEKKAPAPPREPRLTPGDVERFSALQLCDWISQRLLLAGADPADLRLLRDRVEELEEVHDQARTAVEKLTAVVEKLRAPALRLGTLLHRLAADRALVCVSGTDYVCGVDPSLAADALATGTRVLLNEAYAVTAGFGPDRGGPVVKVAEILPDGRLRVGQEAGIADTVVVRGAAIGKERLKPGAEVRLDANHRVAVEIIGHGRRLDRTLTSVEPLPWSAIGGQADAVRAIRDSIELPLLHSELFRRFKHSVPKGFLLHGPPGCGKTLLGKATAHNLRLQVREVTGIDRPEFFLSVKGPEILNMWLGESERQVRDLFAQCREKAGEGRLAFLFIDEAEAILGTRHALRGGTNILATLVPMFCSEMDGLEPLQNVVVILASNRADLIDPAVLRPGRIDRKIRVRRPDEVAAAEIYGIYLTDDLPLADSRDALVRAITAAHYARGENNRFLEVTYRSGRREHLYRGDLASGAIIAAVVERAKEYAIVRSIAEGRESPVAIRDLVEALEHEYRENDLFPPNDITEDWLKLTDFDPNNVVRLEPYRAAKERGAAEAII